MNCFKISIFVLSNTTQVLLKGALIMLWIALKLVSLYYQTQPCLTNWLIRAVVNCFKISIFVLSNTTKSRPLINPTPLWIALKLVSLYYQTQLVRWFRYWNIVVNCFKISIFVLSNTTFCFSTFESVMLWIALKLVSLYYQTQLCYNVCY